MCSYTIAGMGEDESKFTARGQHLTRQDKAQPALCKHHRPEFESMEDPIEIRSGLPASTVLGRAA